MAAARRRTRAGVDHGAAASLGAKGSVSSIQSAQPNRPVIAPMAIDVTHDLGPFRGMYFSQKSKRTHGTSNNRRA